MDDLSFRSLLASYVMNRNITGFVYKLEVESEAA